jgi:IS30 family transposase
MLGKDMVGMRRYMVQELLAAKLSNRQIANVLQLSKETVHADRSHNRALYTEKLLASADVHRARLLKEQMELKDQALQGFDESRRRKTTTIQDGDEGKSSTSIRIEESAGDHGFLNVAKNALVEQAKLLGLHELKHEENQDKSYRQFLQDLSKTIDKEKEIKQVDDLREGALPVEAEDIADQDRGISFKQSEEPDKGPDGKALSDLSINNY